MLDKDYETLAPFLKGANDLMNILVDPDDKRRLMEINVKTISREQYRKAYNDTVCFFSVSETFERSKTNALLMEQNSIRGDYFCVNVIDIPAINWSALKPRDKSRGL